VKAFFLLAGLLAATAGWQARSGADGPLLVAQAEPRGLAFDVFIRLQKGMSEGELILRAGKPDSESIENMRNNIVKTFYYFPTAADPWITSIRLEGGRIAELERIKKF
jgi:hypothetical protein